MTRRRRRTLLAGTLLVALTIGACTHENDADRTASNVKPEPPQGSITVEPSTVAPGQVVELSGTGFPGHSRDIMLQLVLPGGRTHDIALVGTFGIDEHGRIGPATATIPTQLNAAAEAPSQPLRPGVWSIIIDGDLATELGRLTIEQP